MRASARPFARWVLACIICLGSTPALAARITDLASSFDDKFWAVDLRVGYTHTLRRGAIKRELGGLSADAVGLVKDLRFTNIRDTLNLRSSVTFLKAIQLYFELPIVLQDTRSIDFAQNGGSDCGSPPETNCVTPRNSTLVRDGFFDGAAMTPNQVNIANSDIRPAGGYLLPNRKGLDQLHIGLAGSPLSQQRDSTKPTWVIGFEARIAIGDPMEYNPWVRNSSGGYDYSVNNAQANTAIGRGVHQYVWWTSISHRYRYVDPWATFHYMLPQMKDGSLFDRSTFSLSGQERSNPVQRGGGEIGIEFIPFEKPEKHQRVSIELSGKLEGVFEGRDYSDMWEIFANHPVLAGPCRPDLASYDPARWNNGRFCASSTDTIPYPGVTSTENYAVFGGTFAIAVEMTRFFRARIGVSFSHEQQHVITFGDAGKSGNVVGKLDVKDETQVNPMYRPMIDLTGRRFRVSETTVFDIFLSAQGQF
jgi:hypothetical protein